MQPYNIVTAGKNDLEALVALAREIWFAHYPGIITTRQISYMLDQSYTVDTLAKDLASGTRIELLVIANEPKGFAAYGPVPGGELHDGIVEAKLHKLYLHQSFHGQGLGSTLLQHIESECRENDIHQLTLNVNKHNSSAIKTYRRCGYQVTKSVLEPIGEGYFMDDYVMARRLD